MPYLIEQEKQMFEASLGCLAVDFNQYSISPGSLNYLFTKIIQMYLKKKGVNYTYLNDVVGALENCKLELYRRQISEYENLKIEENGDVY